MRARAVKLLALASVCVVASGIGCAAVLGFEDTKLRGDEANDASTNDVTSPDSSEARTGRLGAEPTAIVVRRGGSAEITITLDRALSISGAFTARLDKLPQGVTATTAAIADGAGSGSLTVTASGGAALGQTDLDLAIDPPALPPAPISLLVADSPGGRDETFADKGEAADATRGVGSTYYALARQADGKILAAGGASGSWLVRRLAPDGTADAAFTAAAVGLPLNGDVRAIAIDATGRIVLAGTAAPDGGTAQVTLARLTPTGALDGMFGDGGIVRATFSDLALGSQGTGVAVLSTGAIVVVGLRKDIFEDEAIALGFRPNGGRDTGFGQNGMLSLKKTTLSAVLAEANDAIVLCGTSLTGGSSYFVSRLASDGDPETGFGQNGVLTFGPGSRGQACARSAAGNYVIVGDSTNPANTYTAGTSSSTGTPIWARGVATGPGAVFRAVASTPDGRIVAAGHTNPPNGEARVDRILPDASVDPSFGDGGAVFIEPRGSVNATEVTLFAAALQPDGRILVAGNRTNGGAVVYRLWP